MKLSNSAIDKYKTCPRMYKLHYIDNLRPTYAFSSLFFGSAIDASLNRLLLEKKKVLSEQEQELMEQEPLDIFHDKMATIDINGKLVNTKTSISVNYYASDVDLSVLHGDDLKDIKTFSNDDFLNLDIFLKDCQKQIKAGVGLSEEEQMIKNYITYLCLLRKGAMFLDIYKAEIIPQIEDVSEIQKEILLPDGNGNHITGFIDFIAKFKNQDVYRVMDNKTSSEPYTMENINTSQQLALYSEFAENRNVGYVVLNKKLKKTIPRVKTQMLFGTISEQLVEKTFDTVGETLYNVKNEVFPQKLDNCYQYGRKCAYYNYCRDESNMKGLEKVEKKEK